jgi:tetratricopeptide (TPR) repeat protein
MLFFEPLQLLRIFRDYPWIVYLWHAHIMSSTNRNGIRYMTEAAADRDDEGAYKVRFALGATLLTLESYAEAVPLLESAVRYSTEHHGATNWVTMRQRNDLGIAMNRAGNDDEALKVYEEVLEDQERELGPDAPDVASTLNNIGALLRDKGRFEEVLEIYERALEIRKNEFGWEHSDTAESLGNMGALMIDLEQYEDAWPYLQEALEVYGKVKGPGHLDNARPLWRMGSLLRREEKYAEAQPLYERVLKIREAALGQENRYVFESLDELGSVLAQQGAFEESQPYFERALEFSQRLYGENHPDTAMTLNKLASVLAEQQKYEEAQPFFERELAISDKIMGPDHPQTAQCLDNLANVLCHQDLYADAQPHLERAVEIKVFGDDYLGAAISMNNSAYLLQSMGMTSQDSSLLARALMYQQLALAIFERELGDNHPYTARLLYFTAVSLQMLGRFDEARPYMVRSLAACENVFGTDVPFTEMIRENLRLLDKAINDEGVNPEAT